MENKELIAALRSTESRSKRELLNEAANALEAAYAEIERLKNSNEVLRAERDDLHKNNCDLRTSISAAKTENERLELFGALQPDFVRINDWFDSIHREADTAKSESAKLRAENEFLRKNNVSHQVYQQACEERDASVADCHHNDACSVCIGSAVEISGCDCECLGCALDCRCRDCRDEDKREYHGGTTSKDAKTHEVGK